ncbi:hypothetical protein F6X37_26880 [Paraburkholderia sp. 31.1]|uniref:c-type cytochrome n=1 Tax=Paraburkholderia sp. 31.1 TaxID=2615205 RepID=UPI0016551233|nr:hypothetical protein [Paraburkholderia sp. 31.1]MBC8725074.1 hypothetical protein [Paraburkholderia sp. 31.1]
MCSASAMTAGVAYGEPEPSAVDAREHKLRLGGKAHWGDTPMPPAAERGGPLSAQDAHTLVQWVLSQ